MSHWDIGNRTALRVILRAERAAAFAKGFAGRILGRRYAPVPGHQADYQAGVVFANKVLGKHHTYD